MAAMVVCSLVVRDLYQFYSSSVRFGLSYVWRLRILTVPVCHFLSRAWQRNDTSPCQL